MFKDVEQGLAKYREQLASYKEFHEKNVGNRNPLILSKPVYADATRWTSHLKGMAMALGLTDEEVETLDREFGLAEEAPQEETIKL